MSDLVTYTTSIVAYRRPILHLSSSYRRPILYLLSIVFLLFIYHESSPIVGLSRIIFICPRPVFISIVVVV